MAWNDFYITPTGSDLNSGSTLDNASLFTYAGGTFVRATGVFTVASGNPLTDGVAEGDYVSIYTTATPAVHQTIAKVLSRDATTITVDYTTYKIGPFTNVSEGAGLTTCKVGGAWATMAVGTNIFVTQTMTMNARINIKAGTYANTTTSAYASASGTTAFPIWWRGYKDTITAGVGDRDTAGGTRVAGTDIPLITFTTGHMVVGGSYQLFTNIDFVSGYNAATSGTVSLAGAKTDMIRCRMENTAAHANGTAINSGSAAPHHLIGCRIKSTQTATEALTVSYPTYLLGCHIIGGISALHNTGTCIMDHCIIEGFTTNGINCAITTQASAFVNTRSIAPPEVR